MRKSLTKEERLKRQTDINRVFAARKRVTCNGAKLVYRENGLSRNRMTVTLVRKYGNAVKRNRAKRVVREAYRELKASMNTGFDMVIILYPSEDTYWNRLRQLQKLCSRAGLFTEPGLRG